MGFIHLAVCVSNCMSVKEIWRNINGMNRSCEIFQTIPPLIKKFLSRGPGSPGLQGKDVVKIEQCLQKLYSPSYFAQHPLFEP